jgi:hypothetical protein
MMRNKIFGAIGAIWGALIILNWLFGTRPDGNTAYQSGQSAAVIMGVIMLFAGLYYFFKKPVSKQDEKTPETNE